MPTIKDVAKKAGVGIATVSRVLNNQPRVKESTRLKVQAVINELGYTPNELARSMTKQRSGIIGFVVPYSHHIFFASLIYHLENALSQLNYKLMVCNSGSDAQKEIELIGMLKNQRVDGIVFLTSNDIEKDIPKNYPVISFDRRFDGIPYVTTDNFKGGQLAAKNLLESGAKKLLFIGDDAQGELSRITTEVSKRRQGFVSHLEAVGFKDYKVIEYPQGDLFIPKNFIREIVQRHIDYDGIFAISDELGYTLIQLYQEIGKKIPDDVKIISFDGIEGPFFNLGGLTALQQPIEAIGFHIAANITAMIEGEDVTDIILPVSLRKGFST
jgi:DNA-binding LacI/PurR family transcriptional regulator